VHVIGHILSLIPIWAKSVLLTVALGYALWKAIISSMAGVIRKVYFTRFDKSTLSILPMTGTLLPDIARLRKKSEPKTLRSLRRLRERDLVLSVHVDDLPDDYIWKKLSPPR
jgi:hypothetical protein